MGFLHLTLLVMTSREELDNLYKLVDSLTQENKTMLCKVLLSVLKGKGNESDKGNLAQNPVLVDILFQDIGITQAGTKASLSCWFDEKALSNLEILAQG